MKTANKTMRRKSSKTGTTRAAGVLVVGVLIVAFNMTSDQGWDSTTASAAEVVTYPAPAGEALSADYKLQVADQKVDVYMARVLDPPFASKQWDYGGSYSFANFDMSGRVVVRIVSKRSLRNVVIRPQSSGIKPTLEDDHTLSLTLDRPRKLSIEPDGKKGPLLLFANPLETNAPKPGDKGVVYFGPGVHKPVKIVLKSDQTHTNLVSPHFLIHHDEDAEVYINGQLAVKLPHHNAFYTLVPLDKETMRLLKAKENCMAVHCRNTNRPQYIDVGIVDVIPNKERK